MSELDFVEVLKMFDTFIVLLENPTVSEGMDVQNDVVKAFQCAQFIETAIAKADELDKETILENHLHSYWLKSGRANLYKCSELKKACDRLLEVYLKDSIIPVDVVDEFLKLYVQHCGASRLNEFLKNVVTNGICANLIIESLEQLGVSTSDMQDEALIMTWESLIKNDNEFEVSECICKMFNDGLSSKLVQFAVNLPDNSKVKQLIIKTLSNSLVKNDVNVCIALVNIGKRSLWKLMEKDLEFYTNFLDAIFYFARHMKQDRDRWVSNYEFKYEHLVEVARTLLNGPAEISEIMHNRVQLVKTHPNGTIWCKVENYIR